MAYETIVLERSGGITTLRLNRPESMNAIDLVMRKELVQALDELAVDANTRVLILSGTGDHFCAGGDIRMMQSRRLTAEEGRIRVGGLNRVITRLAGMPQPTIAMVDGAAVGAGTTLALCCDLVIASDRARFGQPFWKIGLVPDGGGTWLLPRIIGMARAKQMIFTAEIMGAAEAGRIGLVNEVVPTADLRRVTEELAAKIAAAPPAVLRMTKQMLNKSIGTDLSAALELEALSQGIAISSEDHHEGVAAFLEKRKPKFTGQ
jgi:2-(1,2-epoxy-1,2-dihydrophenyl)acetyl-CoA isomerase